MTLAKRLTERMKEIDFTQEMLAERAKVSQTTIHKLATGKALETRKLLQIAQALGVSAVWLQSGIEPKTPTALHSNVEPGPDLTLSLIHI